MSDTEPLLKHAGRTLQPNSEAKIFFTAEELLQHVRHKYSLSLHIPRKRKGYTCLLPTSDGFYVSEDLEKQLPEQNGSEGNVTGSRIAEFDSRTISHSKRSVQSGFINKQDNIRTFEPTTKHLYADSRTVNTSLSCHNDSISPTVKRDVNKCSCFLAPPASGQRDACYHGNRVPKADDCELKKADNLHIGHLQKESVGAISGSLISVTTSTSVEGQRIRGYQYSEADVKHGQNYGRWTEPKGLTTCKMASLQSPRTQCCCCAVGVFAAMFGIFMLSAGICIVLNVTFMEVDTSGLPPDLHNENGKKVVGIILICVAIAFLGLSATVSILYFTMCSRKSRAPVTATTNGYHKQQKNTPVGATAGQEQRPKNRDGLPPIKKRMAPVYLDGVQMSRSVAHLRPDYSKPKSYRGRKGALSRSVLPPHQEEDPETVKPNMELAIANETYQARRPKIKNALGKKEAASEGATSASVLVKPFPKARAPIILLESDLNPTNNDCMETQLNDTVSIFEEDSVSNAYSELYEETASAGRVSPNGTAESDFTNKSRIRVNEFEGFRKKQLEDSFLQPPPELPHNVDVRTDLSSPYSVNDSSLLPPIHNLQHNFLVVRPALGADLGIPAASTSSSSSSSNTTIDAMAAEENDRLPDLPLTVGRQNSQQNHNEQDSRSESRSSFNSAFSFDGDDPGQSEMERLQKRMEKCLESDSSECGK